MALTGKVAFVTGGAQGLGKGFVEALLQREAKVSFVDINAELGNSSNNEFKSKYGEESAIFNKCDVTDIANLRECYQKTIDTFGGLDIVINNAGITDEINFERTIDVNLTAVIRSSYMAAHLMGKDKGGNGGLIVNVASFCALHPSPYILTYTAVKHGVVGFSRAMALNIEDKAKFGLSIASLCPSFVDTELGNPKGVPTETTKPEDLVMPNIEETAKTILEKIRSSEMMEVKTVVNGMLELIFEPNNNGAVLSILPSGAKYVYPEILTKKLVTL